MVIIDFEMGVSPFIYRDSIVLSEEEMQTVDIEKIKQDRYDAWYSIVNPPQEEQ